MRKLILIAAVALTGCTTPVTTMRDGTGSEVHCGGKITQETAGSPAAMLGLAGMFLTQIVKDGHCVDNYEQHGYTTTTGGK